MNEKDVSVKAGFDAFGEVEVAQASEKPKRSSFTVRHDTDTKDLLDDLQWLKQYVVTKQPISQGDVVREALELLAKKMGYDKLKKEYSKELSNATISAGRKKGS